MYQNHDRTDPQNPMTREDSTYPADPDSEYGWEKLFSERLSLSYSSNYRMQCRVARSGLKPPLALATDTIATTRD